MVRIESVEEGDFFGPGPIITSRFTSVVSSSQQPETEPARTEADLVSMHLLDRVMRVTDIRSCRQETPSISHGVVTYRNPGGTLIISSGCIRLRLPADDRRDRRIIRASDSSLGRLLKMSSDCATVHVDLCGEVLDGAWPALLTVQVLNQMRVVDVILSGFGRTEDGSETYEVRPWSDQDRMTLKMLFETDGGFDSP